MSRREAPDRLTELAPVEVGGWILRLRARLRTGVPRARVFASEARLGTRLDVEWRLDHGARAITNISVALVGTEVARQRISARTGISVVAQRHPFLTLALDRQMPEPAARTSAGRGSVTITAPAVPTLIGRLNEISWAIVVEAAFQAEPIWTREFAVTVRRVAP
ncbi:MAG TPA: hypothetical protein VHG72_03125 [Polyangia bacterium]|nr:hypothetical protein [Polyangia bacterium]